MTITQAAHDYRTRTQARLEAEIMIKMRELLLNTTYLVAEDPELSTFGSAKIEAKAVVKEKVLETLEFILTESLNAQAS